MFASQHLAILWIGFDTGQSAEPFLFALQFTLLIIFLYAEIHFRLPGIPSRLNIAEPEIVFDLPIRATFSEAVPLFLFIKDAHQYPVSITAAQVRVMRNDKTTEHSWDINELVETKFDARTFQISPDLFPETGEYKVDARLTYSMNGEPRTLHQDNYRTISHEPMTLLVAEHVLPRLDRWYFGDIHLHSNYTDDAVEYGAPIRDTIRCAKTLGLQFLAVTDHSFDLDDDPDNYLRSDPAVPKWQKFQEECSRIDSEETEFALIPGEEVSVGNCRNENVHCLVLGDSTFHPGSGDGGEGFHSRKPTLKLPELRTRISESSLMIAAHPFDQPPTSQALLLNRGYWHPPDLEQVALWQIANGRLDRFFENGRQAWIEALLSGHKIGIVGGTDAHGNFNSFRQVSLPFLKLIKHREQLLGQVMTAVKVDGDFNRDSVIEAIRSLKAVVTTGPLLDLTVLVNDRSFETGSELSDYDSIMVQLIAKTTVEFGNLSKLRLHFGQLGASAEAVFELNPHPGIETFALHEFKSLSKGYVRAEAECFADGERHLCLTNPIWFV